MSPILSALEVVHTRWNEYRWNEYNILTNSNMTCHSWVLLVSHWKQHSLRLQSKLLVLNAYTILEPAIDDATIFSRSLPISSSWFRISLGGNAVYFSGTLQWYTERHTLMTEYTECPLRDWMCSRRWLLLAVRFLFFSLIGWFAIVRKGLICVKVKFGGKKVENRAIDLNLLTGLLGML